MSKQEVQAARTYHHVIHRVSAKCQGEAELELVQYTVILYGP